MTNGLLWIGSTALNAGGTHVNVGTLTSPGSSVNIGYSSPNITLSAGSSVATTYATDSGNAVPSSNTLNIIGDGLITTTGSGNTVTINSPSEISGVIRGPDVNFLVTGNTNIYTFAADFIFTGIVLTATSVTGTPNADYQFNLGWTAPNYTNIANGYLSTGGPSAVNFETGTPLGVVLTDFSRIPAGQTLVIRITTAESVASVYTLRVDIMGYYFSGNPPNPPTLPITYTANDAGTATPTLGNVNLFARSGSTTIASSSTLTVLSPAYADQGGSTSVSKNTGSFSTASITLTTPVTAGLADGDLLEFVATTAGALTIQLAATQVAHLGNVTSSVAGTLVSTAIGDSISLRYQASTNDWWATSSVGNWTIT